ncbi:phosphatase PAP2 family protein [Streptomyces axinellae]|uniref:Phosphatidic acid phosphatase type 2/haloperoxidase domain-containing protein n=1 Tax=Streptomyces axinellae TaxID=552788 RepID=A0ABN3PWI3_9ACTN
MTGELPSEDRDGASPLDTPGHESLSVSRKGRVRGRSRSRSRSQEERPRALIAALLGCLLCFAATSALVLGSGAGFVDGPVLNQTVAHRADVLDGPMAFVTRVSEIPLLLLSVLVACWLAWRDRSWSPLVLVGGAGLLAVLVSTAAKELTERHRPPARLWAIPEDGFCYPSRHTVIATAVLLILTWMLAARLASRAARAAGWLGAGALCWLVGASRVYLAVHWPTDVLGGLALGAAVALAVVAARALVNAARPTPGAPSGTAAGTAPASGRAAGPGSG